MGKEGKGEKAHCVLKEEVSISSRSAQERGYPVPPHNLYGGNGSLWMQRLKENNFWIASDRD